MHSIEQAWTSNGSRSVPTTRVIQRRTMYPDILLTMFSVAHVSLRNPAAGT